LFSGIVGIGCYYTDNEINAHAKICILIYQKGLWKDNLNKKTLTILTNEYAGASKKILDETYN